MAGILCTITFPLGCPREIEKGKPKVQIEAPVEFLELAASLLHLEVMDNSFSDPGSVVIVLQVFRLYLRLFYSTLYLETGRVRLGLGTG